MNPDFDDDLPRGCAFYESSRDLVQGLEVSESSLDRWTALLPLADWLALHLAGQPRAALAA